MAFLYGFSKKIKLGGSASRIQVRISRAVFSLLIACIAAIGTNLIVRAAPTILATMTAAFIGGDGDGKADPGETIEYTAVVQNTGTDATGVTFSDIIDLNTTLVADSLNVSPLALDDSYDTIGNTLLEVGVTASGNPAVLVTTSTIDSLFDNDTEFLGDTFTLKSVEVDTVAPFTTATEAGGLVTVEADGNFSYTPPLGFSGADHFDYVLTDDGPDNILGNADDLTGAGRVTINVNTQRVWYVKNDAVAGGDGRSSSPFDTLAEAQTASTANDTIYIYAGNGTTAGQNAGITLKNGQRLLGEGVALTVSISSGSFNGLPSPTTVALRIAGSQPQIDNTGGFGVSVPDISNVQIFGLNIAGSTNAVNVTTTAANSGSFEFANNTIRSAGANGVDVNGGGTGTLTVNLHDNTVTANGNGIDIQRTAGSVVITTFDDNVVSGNTLGTGINVVGTGATVLFDSNPATTAFETVLGGATIIGQSGNGVGTAGMVLNNTLGDLSFSDLDIYADNGAALFVSGTTSNFNAATSTGMRLVANTGTPTLAAVGGAALDVADANINIVPTAFSSSITTAIRGVSLLRVSGTLTAPVGSTIISTSSTGTGFFVDGSSNTNANVNVTYPGTITADIGRLIQIQNVTPSVAASYIFSGAITDNTDGDGGEQGVSLTGNTNATVTFSGGLAIRTTTSAAFTATGGGTVNVCDENPCNPAATGALVNTLTTTTGTALNVANTNIGSNNLEFRSISANGATKGIILNTTGSSGGLKIVGTGTTDGSGGTIQNISARGAEFISTSNLSLKNMNFANANNSTDAGGAGICDDLTTTACNAAIYLSSVTTVALDNLNITGTMVEEGINGNTVSNFTLSNSTVSNCGNEVEEGCIKMRGLTGTSSISNSDIAFPGADVVEIVNSSGSLLLNVDNSTFRDSQSSASGNTGIQLRNQGTASGIINVNNSSFLRIRTHGLNVQAINNGTADVDVTGSTFDPGTGTMIGMSLEADNNGILKFNVQANTKIYSRNGPAINIFGDTNAVINGRINNNSDVKVLSNVGSNVGSGIRVNINKDATAKIEIKNNVVNLGSDDSGIDLSGIGKTTANPGGATNTLDATVTGNNVTIGATSAYGIVILSATNAGDTNAICANVATNVITRNPSSIFSFRARAVSASGFFRMNGFVTNAEATWNANSNTPASSGGSEVSYGGSGTFGACTAAVPTNPALSPVAMLIDNNPTVAQTQPETNLLIVAQAPGVDLNTVNTFAAAYASVKSSQQAAEINLLNNVVKASTSSGGKPLFSVQPAPLLSGEAVSVPAFTLPAGKSVTIKFRVTVNDPLTLGTTQISNQGTVSGSNFSNVLTDDPSVGGGSDPTLTLVDRPDTTVSSINRHTPSNTSTNATSVVWRVTFANPVAGLTSSNFTLANTGLTSPSITTVSAVTASPATQWDVTVNTGSGDGTLGLDFANDTGLSHDVPAFTTGQVYTIDKTAPAVSSIKRQSPTGNPTSANLLIFRVTFNEPVTSVGANSFVASGTTTTIDAGSTTAITPNLVFDFYVNGSLNGDLSNLNGAVGLNIAASPSITDLAGNTLQVVEPLPAITNDETYTVDNTAPTVTSITRQSPSSNPTNADVLVFRVTFNEPVTSVGANSFIANGTTTSVGASVVAVTPNLVFDFTVDGTANGDLTNLNGTVGLNVAASPTITDLAGNTLAVVEPAPAGNDQTYTVDNTAPTITNITSTSTDDTYGTGVVIPVTVTFSEAVTVTGTPQLTLETSGTDRVVNYSSGSGTNTLTFNYTVQVGDASADLDYVATTSLALNSGTIQDATTNNAILTLSAPGAPGSLGFNKAIAIDTIAPMIADVTSTITNGTYGLGEVIPVTVTFSEVVTVTGTPQLTLETGTTDRVVNYTSGSGTITLTFNYTVQAGDTSADLDYIGTTALTLNSGTIKDEAANNATLTLAYPGAAGSLGFNKAIVIDAIVPTITNVTSTAANGSYTTGAVIPVTVTFSEPVTVGGSPQLTLETGTTDRVVDYTSGSGTATLTFNYTVQAGDSSTDLDNAGTTALALNSGTIKDVTLNDAILTLATPGTSGSLGFNKAILIDAIAPNTTIQTNPTNPTNNPNAGFTFTGDDGTGVGGLTFECKLDGGSFATCTSPQANFGLTNGFHTFSVRAKDSLGNTDSSPASYTWEVDTLSPTVVSITSTASSPTNISPIPVTITFSEPVYGFDSATGIDLNVTNGTTSGLTSGTDGDTVYTFDLTPAGQGPMSLYLKNGGVYDLTSNYNSANSSPFSITYDSVSPTVTINQAGTQTDPTSTSPINFTVVFSESVTGFIGADVNLGGTAGATTASVTEISPNNGTTYNVAISGMTSVGTVIASIPSGGSQDAANNGNTPSVSTDNAVTFLITYTISGNAGVGGATLSYTNGGPQTVIADSNGNYSFTVSHGWAGGTVTPSKAGYAFTPISRTYSNVLASQNAENYTATNSSGVQVIAGSTVVGNYTIAPQGSKADSYASLNSGPVKVTSANNLPFLVEQRHAWLLNGVVQNVSEMLGVPANQLTDTYYFPWNNTVTMDMPLRIANLGNTSTYITVTIAGVAQTPIPLAAGASTQVSYPGINNGPVKVQSSGGMPIAVTQRGIWLLNGVVQSFAEMTGLPGNQLTDTYYFPWYNNVTMDMQFRLANLGNTGTNITVTIGGVAQPVIPLAAGASTRISYPVNNGPVKVQSSGGVPIIVSERGAWLVNGMVKSFSEMIGLPGNQLTTTYYFPWYNNVTMDTQFRFANLGNTSTDITVTIAGVAQAPITVAAGQSTRINYPGINNGSVKVESSGGVPIIVTERDAWLINGVVNSFSELMGLPAGSLTTTYYFPWYNNTTMSTLLRFAVP